MKKYIIYLIPALFVLVLISCTKLNLQVADPDKAVIEGYLVPGENIEIKITKQLDFVNSDTVVTPIEDLVVNFANTDQEVILEYNETEKVYQTSEITIEPGLVYNIDFGYKDYTVSSSSYVPTKPVGFSASASSLTMEDSFRGYMSFEQVELSWDNPDNEYFMVVVENIEANPESLVDTSNFRPPRFFRNTPIQSNIYNMRAQNFSYFGTHYLILVKLNPEYAELYEGNGSNSLNLETPPGNIENGLGIFTGINTDTLMFEVIKGSY
ncbi:MAG: DUF4249 family protein [Bacteroidales bacterium]|nr:DUF4249 family protein [Bacteroidales bacterium]